MVNGSPREFPESTQCTPQGEDSRSPKGFSEGEPEATSKARPKAKNPRGRRPQGFLALVWPRMWPRVRLQKIPKGAFNIPLREYIEYSRDLPRAPFTMIPSRLSNRFSFFLPKALLYYVKREKQTNKLFSNGTLGSSVVNVSSSRYKH